MTVVCMPIDASAGVPAYTAQQYRQAQSGVWANGTTRPLGSQSGIVAGSAPVVTASSTTWSVGLSSFVVDAAFTTIQAPYTVAIVVAETGSVTAAHATLNRYDMLYLIVNDTAIDGSGSRNGQVVYVAGTGTSLAASPVPQTTPARSVKIADILVPLSGGGSPTVTVAQQYTVASGGILPIPTAAARAAQITTPYDGYPIYRQDWNAFQAYNGATWDTFPVAGSGTASLDGNGSGGRITGGTSGAPQTLHTPTPTSLTAPPWANNARIVVLLSGIYLDTGTGNNFQARITFGPTSGAYRRVQEVPTVGPRFPTSWIDTLAVTAGAANTMTVQAYRVSGTGGLNCDAVSQVSFAVDWLP